MTHHPLLPDLQTQLEDLFHAVWNQEKMWRTEDRIDAAVRLHASTGCPERHDRTRR
jgi:hypothetical protein